MKKFAALCAVLSVAATVAAVAMPTYAGGRDADADYNAGVTAYNARNYEAAIDAFTHATLLRPRFGDAYFNRGLCHEARQEWDAAIADFSKVFETKPKLADAYLERARSYTGKKQFQNAMADFQKALELRPQETDIYLFRGQAYLDQDRFPEAIADLTRFIADAGAKAADQKADAFLSLGNAYRDSGSRLQAVDAYHNAIDLLPAGDPRVGDARQRIADIAAGP